MEINKVYLGDSLDIIKRFPDECIDCVITSPPYDNLRTYNGIDGWGFEKFKGIADQLSRVLKRGGVIVWVVSDGTEKGSETGTSFRQALYFKEIGLNIHDTMIWKKESCAFPETTRYYPNFEYMFVFSKGRPKTINLISDRKNIWGGTAVHGTFREKDGTLHGRSTTWKDVVCKDYGVRFNVWEITSEKQNKTQHPAVFPVKLARDHIITWTNKGDLVLDPFMGSGTTGVAARMLGRNFIGCEISPEYQRIAEQRIFNEGENLFNQ